MLNENTVNPNHNERVITVRAGVIALPTDEYWRLLRAQRELEILHSAYYYTKYGTIDSTVCESVFGPKPKPEPEPEPAPDPSVLLAKVTDMTEKAQRLLEEIESRQVKSDA